MAQQDEWLSIKLQYVGSTVCIFVLTLFAARTTRIELLLAVLLAPGCFVNGYNLVIFLLGLACIGNSRHQSRAALLIAIHQLAGIAPVFIDDMQAFKSWLKLPLSQQALLAVNVLLLAAYEISLWWFVLRSRPKSRSKAKSDPSTQLQAPEWMLSEPLELPSAAATPSSGIDPCDKSQENDGT